MTPPTRPSSQRRRTPLTITVAAGAVIVGLLATMAFVSPGYPTQKVEINDASVWVTNDSQQMIGLANTELARLSTAVSSKSNSLRVIQAPGRLLVHNAAGNNLDIYDPASFTSIGTVPLPQGSPQIEAGGDHLLMYEPGSGDLWISRYDDLARFDQKSPPTSNIGVDAVLTADTEDRYVGYSTKNGTVLVGALTSDAPAKLDKIDFSEPGAEVQATLVAGTPVLYDPKAGQVWIDGTLISVAGVVTSPDSAALMQPTATGDRVLIAFDGGLIAIDLSGGQITSVTSASGPAAAPVRLGSCEFAVWGEGTAYRDCGTPESIPLTGANGSTPIIAVNGRTVVASEPETGLTWAIQRSGEQIANWADFIDDSKIVEQQEETSDKPPELEADQKPPIALDDTFGVRAGRANALSVLINDSDANGDAIIITDSTEIPESFGRLERINNNQQLQITTTPEASGTVSFDYTISDGYGNEATATVHLTAISPEVNEPPIQVRQTHTSVAYGGTAKVAVLDDWIDPESDPMYLADANIAGGDTVTFTPGGWLEFTDSGAPGALKTVNLKVSDGTTDGSGTANVSVDSIGTVPIIAENFAVSGFVGQEITVEPLIEVRGGTGAISLNAANPAPGYDSLTLTRNYPAGHFTVLVTTPGTHFVEYSVTDGKDSATALVRLDIRPSQDDDLPPVTVPTTAFLSVNSTQLVDVLATDYDPAGGVLSIVGVEGIDKDSGIIAEIVDLRILRVTLTKSLESSPVDLSYQVTNGSRSATGTLSLVEVPEPARLQPPVAEPDVATARVGSVIEIPAMDNDHHPNGKPLTLEPKLTADLPQGGGTLVVSGDVLRYLAPEVPGEYSASYRVTSIDGQFATAKVSITVLDIDAAKNRAPEPKTITTRVRAGQTTKIPIPLTSIDTNGDRVRLIGPSSAPQLGAVGEVGDSWLTYTASKYLDKAGTDTFTYTVTDDLGASAEGTIRVGVVPDFAEAAPPVAMDDSVKTRPGTTLSVNVVDNDSDPAQSTFAVSAIEAAPGLLATHTDRLIKLTAPKEPGSYAIMYTITNAAGMESKAWLHVQVSADAPLVAPTATDFILTLQDLDGYSTVDADVLSGVTFTEGPVKTLNLTVPDWVTGAHVTASKKVAVEVLAKSRILPFTVSRSDDPSVSATAFLWIAGTDDAAPELRRDRPALTVVSGERLTIPINDHVIAATNKAVTLDNLAEISATHNDHSELRTNDSTLTFVSAADYWGPASITFTVTDGRTRSTLTLPITVTPANDQPPVLKSAAIQLESGMEMPLDLLGLTDYPGEKSQLTYTLGDSNQGVVTAAISGSVLTIRAVDGAQIGIQDRILVSVRDNIQPGTSGVVTVTIVKSTQPTVSAVADEITILRGESQTLDVLANDAATNPFPGKPLRVVSVGNQVPPGVQVSPSADKRMVNVTVGKDAPTGTVALPYQVADATDDADRYVTGTISIHIQDVPDAPNGPPREISRDAENATVTLAVPHAFANFSEITEYVVTTADGAVVARCTNPDACVIKNIAYGQAYQFSAYASNGVGSGAPSLLSETILVDIIPKAPQEVTLASTALDQNGHSMQVNWSNVGQITKGTPIEGFDVTLNGPNVELSVKALAGDTKLDLFAEGITPNSEYTVTIRARNATGSGEPGTASTFAIGPPSISSASVAPEKDGRVKVEFHDGYANGGGGPFYSVGPVDDSINWGDVCDNTTFRADTQENWWIGDKWTPKKQYSIKVSNGLFCRIFISGEAPPLPQVTAGNVGLTGGTTGPDRTLRADNLQASGSVDHYEYRLSIEGYGPVDWTAFRPGSTEIDLPATYGRATTLYVRACFGQAAATCSPEPDRKLGTVTPLHLAPQDPKCFVSGGQPRATLPFNNNLSLTINIRYTEITVEGAHIDLTAWQSLSDPVPAITAGSTLEAEWRTSFGEASYKLTTTCVA